MRLLDPQFHDRIDAALWELALQIHVGRPKRELVETVQTIRWMRQSEQASEVARQFFSGKSHESPTHQEQRG